MALLHVGRSEIINAFAIKGVIDGIPLTSASTPDAFHEKV